MMIATPSLLQAFSNEAAIAIENARLFQQVRQWQLTADRFIQIDGITLKQPGLSLKQSRRYQHKLALIMMDVDFFHGQ